jgi:hypothetical protein
MDCDERMFRNSGIGVACGRGLWHRSILSETRAGPLRLLYRMRISGIHGQPYGPWPEADFGDAGSNREPQAILSSLSRGVIDARGMAVGRVLRHSDRHFKRLLRKLTHKRECRRQGQADASILSEHSYASQGIVSVKQFTETPRLPCRKH